jgi:hypothetical protein
MRRSVPIPNLGAALVSFDLKPLNNLLFFSVLLGIKSLIFFGSRNTWAALSMSLERLGLCSLCKKFEPDE